MKRHHTTFDPDQLFDSPCEPPDITDDDYYEAGDYDSLLDYLEKHFPKALDGYRESIDFEAQEIANLRLED